MKITGKKGLKSLEKYAKEINRKHFRQNQTRVFKHPNHENVFIIVKDNKFKLTDWESISCDKALYWYILQNLDKLRDAEY